MRRKISCRCLRCIGVVSALTAPGHTPICSTCEFNANERSRSRRKPRRPFVYAVPSALELGVAAGHSCRGAVPWSSTCRSRVHTGFAAKSAPLHPKGLQFPDRGISVGPPPPLELLVFWDGGGPTRAVWLCCQTGRV